MLRITTRAQAKQFLSLHALDLKKKGEERFLNEVTVDQLKLLGKAADKLDERDIDDYLGELYIRKLKGQDGPAGKKRLLKRYAKD